MDIVFTIIGWIVFGLVIGLLARLLVPGKDNIGILPTIGLGVLGSVVGGLVLSLFTGRITLSNPVGWIGSLIFAIILLIIYNRVTGRKQRV
jgi:uncharacterized membrane protein YeaQ/YmgE (transglycosylase-associated protein family)